MPRCCSDIAPVARIIAAQRPVSALDDPLRAFDDAVERRSQRFIQRIVESGSTLRRGGSGGDLLSLCCTAKARENPVGAGHDLAAKHNAAPFVAPAARALAGEAAPRRESTDQRH